VSGTPGQTVGPFFGFALPYADGPQLAPPDAPGAIQLSGHVLDGAGLPVPDALLELWQRHSDGRVPRQAGSLRRDGKTCTGWGRAATDGAGRYSFTTLEPGGTFLVLAVFARGLLDRLLTRVYLPDDPAALARDPLLAALPPDRRDTLVARRDGRHLIFDVVLQGAGETVFLDPGRVGRA
jgi:protocatechuate 3,4-dioxygenase, alpha subunit